MDGLLLIDKPEGWTSHDVVAKLRAVTGIRAIGHAGTLDPFATGLLVLGIGAATKRLADVQSFEKEYLGTVRLGATSSTDDRTGEILRHEIPSVTGTEIIAAMARFRGEIEQIPPMYSAKKVGGRKLYDLARRGQTIERKPATVTIYDLTLAPEQPADFPASFAIRVTCSKGTYIRALARDIGDTLETGGYLEELRRTRIGPYRVEAATKIGDVTKAGWEALLITA